VKVLLDENLPHRLRNALSNHEVFTVRFLGWSGLKNGALLSAAENGGFQVFLTGDQTVSYEQNLSDRQIAVVVLSAIEWHLIRHGLPAIQAAVNVAAAGSLQMIDVGTFRRRPSRPE
jgi:predicted nuclease of predicted toxin-antitoxin system